MPGLLAGKGYAGFERVYTADPLTRQAELSEVVCWAHARRKFFEVHANTASPLAMEALERIGQPRASSTLSAPIGTSRIACTGFSTWPLDEDQSRTRKDHGPENLVRLRRFALNILRTTQNEDSTRGKIKRAAWDDAFLLQLFAAA